MELHQLRYFMAVARFGSFTRAAEHEHVAQPSLSQQIKKLEDELGSRLFDRLGRRITLTDLGGRFQKRARRVLEEVEGVRQEAEALLGLRRGAVAVGAIPTVAPYLLPRALAVFAKSYPGMKVNLREDLTHSLLEQLADGELDVALLGLPVRGTEFVAEPLFHDRMLLAVPSRHPLWRRSRQGRGARRCVAVSDLVHEPLLLLKDGHCFRDDVLHLCKRARLSPNVVFEGGQFDTLVAMVSTGAGVTLIPEIARQHYRRAGIHLLEFEPPAPGRTIGAVRVKDKFVTPGAKAFVEVLGKQGASASA